MRKNRMIMLIMISLLSIGFASVSTVLYLNGSALIGTNQSDFDVYYSKAFENGVENNTLIIDKTHLTFSTDLSLIDEKYVLGYEVTNGSKQYDANLVMNCTGGNEYLRVENDFDLSETLLARTSRRGKLTITVIKPVEEDITVNITCEIRGNAVERTEVGEDDSTEILGDYLIKMSNWAYIYLGHEFAQENVETLNIVKSKDVPDDAIESWDASNNKNGSIMAYTLDEDNDGLYELYIGQDGGVIANPDSGYLFYRLTNLTSINGLENLNTSNVTSMYHMFYSCSRLTSLDLSSFDTSKVTNMSWMFANCNELTDLNISSFDSSKVKDMSDMFYNCGRLITLDLSSFDTNQVTDMSHMFGNCGDLTSIDLSSFDTGSVTNMNGMFQCCYDLTSLDLSVFNTSQVMDMGYMFNCCENLKNLNLNGWDTSNAINMDWLFRNCQNLRTTIVIRGTKCESYEDIVVGSATKNGSEIILSPFSAEEINLVDNMITWASLNSNVRVEYDFPTFSITINGNDDIVSSVSEAYAKRKVTLSSRSKEYAVISFKLNGLSIEGDTFIMPEGEATITDVEVREATIIESPHYPYPVEYELTEEKTFEGASSLTVVLDYETEYEEYDWISIYDSANTEYGPYGGSRRKETITIPGDYIKIVFTSDEFVCGYYGFKAMITPNYE